MTNKKLIGCYIADNLQQNIIGESLVGFEEFLLDNKFINIKTYYLDENEKLLSVLDSLRKVGYIKHYGEVKSISKNSVIVYTSQLQLKIGGDDFKASYENLEGRYGRANLRDIYWKGYCVLNLETYPVIDRLHQQIEILKNLPFITEVDPVVYSPVHLHNIKPANFSSFSKGIQLDDFLYPTQWYLKIMRMPEAWELLSRVSTVHSDITFGSPNVKIAIIDTGIESETISGNTYAKHPDLNVLLTDGSRKISEFYDFVNGVDNNNDISNRHGYHGTACAGVAAASLQSGYGVVGVAPNVRLVSALLKLSQSEGLMAEHFLWVSGFSQNPNLPTIVGADIISNSWGLYELPDIYDVFRDLVNYGRKGRGILNLFSAGNYGILSEDENEYTKSEYALTVGASSCDNDGFTEIKAKYSSVGPNIFICAPSSSYVDVGNSINNYFTYSCRTQTPLSQRYDFHRDKDPDDIMPGKPLNVSRLAMDANVDDATVTIDPADGNKPGFRVGDSIMIRNPEDYDSLVDVLPKWEAFKIRHVSGVSNNILSFDGDGRNDVVTKFHSAGTVVNGGEGRAGIFGGTSHACPAVAGVIALMLSAKPTLTWMEVKDLLKKSAVKINPGELGVADTISGKWKTLNDFDIVDANGDLVSIINTKLVKDAFRKSDMLFVEDASIFEKNQALELKNSSFSEIKIVIGVDKNKGIVYVNKLGADFLSIDTIINVGLFPHKSDFYGYGRVDAAEAIRLTIAYSHDQRDLVIRDYLGDQGATVTNLSTYYIQSPDVWISHTAPPVAPNLIEVPDYKVPAPHEALDETKKRYIYARIKNRGNLYSNLKAYVRFYVALTDGTVPDDIDSLFKFPEDWMGDEIATIDEATVKKTYFVGESIIEEGQIDPGGVFAVSQPWEMSDLPPSDTTLKTFLLVQVAPLDGPLEGLGAEHSNNLTYREVIFAKTIFNDGPIDDESPIEFPKTLPGNDEERQLAIRINSSVGTFLCDQVEVRFVLTDDKSKKSEAVFKKEGGVWALTGLAPDDFPWCTLGLSGSATGEVTEMEFMGSLIPRAGIKSIEVTTVIHSSITGVAISEETHSVQIRSQAGAGSDTDSEKQIPAENLYAFADFSLLPTQDVTTQFGSTSSTEFRLDSLFTGLGAVAPQLKAYAVTSGKAIIQEVVGQPGLVNLVLKPDKQPFTAFSRVQYYVYKGLKKSAFLKADGQVLPKDVAYTDLLKRMWEVREKLNASIADPKVKTLPPQNAGSAVERETPPPGTPAANVASPIQADKQARALNRGDLGLPEIGSSFDENTLLQEIFDTFTFQPIVEGWHLGDFDTSKNYGLQILVEHAHHPHTVADVTAYEHKVVLTYGEGQTQFANNEEEDLHTKLQREKILAYLDPAAYFGLLSEHKVVLPDNKGKITGTEIYDQVISKYATKGRIYVDVRNEHNLSLNFEGNYADSADPRKSAKIQYANASDVLTVKEYHDGNGWPLLILTSTNIGTNDSSDKSKVKLTFPSGNNEMPMLFLAGARLYEEYPGDKKKFKALTAGATYTDAVELGVGNYKSKSLLIPCISKICYSKRYDFEDLPTPSYPAQTLLKDDWMDNLMSPHLVPLSKNYLISYAGNSASRNNLKMSGQYTGDDQTTYTIKIQTDTSTFVWKKGEEAFSSPVAVSSSETELSEGVKVSFNTAVANTANDTWSVIVKPVFANRYLAVKEPQYIGWTSLKGEDYIVRQGLAVDTIGEVAYFFQDGIVEYEEGKTSYTIARMSLDMNKKQSAKKSFFLFLSEELALASVGFMNIKTSVGGQFKTIIMDSEEHFLKDAIYKKSTDDLFSFAYSFEEKFLIKEKEALFLEDLPKYYVALMREALTDANGYLYFKLELGIQGYKLESGNILVQRESTGLVLFSKNAVNYFTEQYAELFYSLVNINETV